MGNTYSQLFPPKATFTEQNLADQTGKVFIVTGSSTGVGKALAEILYSHNAKIYIAARSEERSQAAIESIKSKFPNSKGALAFLHLDLGDLSTIKKSAEDFLGKEDRLDVLWNNAGVMVPPQGSKTEQGYEMQLGTNNVGPFLFTKLLTPKLIETAKSSPSGSVRVVWVSSSAAESFAPTGGVDMSNLDYKTDKSSFHKYGVSKAGNVLHSLEYAKRFPEVISVSCNPGNLKSDLGRHMPAWQKSITNFILYPVIQGAFTELYCGLSPDLTPERNGAWIIPWGRSGPLRKDLQDAGKLESEGGSGRSLQFWNWTEEQVKSFV
ncbi:putative short-chain dehydrogenase [Phlyctema vagabunda]|uniref:Short-chain dehydrogenase n=1 Tax=Phlyctema vagabunda TaxID=108571 RepID=A0ABR4PDP9_9HELO